MSTIEHCKVWITVLSHLENKNQLNKQKSSASGKGKFKNLKIIKASFEIYQIDTLF